MERSNTTKKRSVIIPKDKNNTEILNNPVSTNINIKNIFEI